MEKVVRKVPHHTHPLRRPCTARLNFKITSCDENIQKLEKKKSNVMTDWTKVQLDVLQQNIDDLINYKVDLQRLQAAESKSDK